MSTERRTPYDLVFDAEFETRHFEAIRSEAEQRAAVTWHPEQFLLLHAVGEPLRSVVTTHDSTAVEQFGPLLFQAYNFWRFGKQRFTLSEPLFRLLVGETPRIEQWEMAPLAPAGYLQLPRNLLWARIADDAQPEAVDGMFWTMVGTGDPAVPPFHRIDVLLVLGLLPGRPGFSVIPLSMEMSEPQGHWGDEQARTGTPDFANNLPGGELRGLHALETAGEVWKLLSRAFWYGAMNPSSITTETREMRVVTHG